MGASVPTGSVPGQPSHSQAILLLPRERRSSLCPGRGQMLISVLLTLKILFISVEWFVPGRAAVLGLRSVWEVLGHREMLMFSARCLSPRLWIPKVLFRDSVLADKDVSSKGGEGWAPSVFPGAPSWLALTGSGLYPPLCVFPGGPVLASSCRFWPSSFSVISLPLQGLGRTTFPGCGCCCYLICQMPPASGNRTE